jgi:neutral ceramidase
MRFTLHGLVLVVAFGWCVGNCSGGENEPESSWKGAAVSAVITPETPMKMAGYAARTEPSEGTEQDLFAKALALEDHAGNRLVIVTLDLIGVIEKLRNEVAARVEEECQLPPASLLMNASHTHCGPAYGNEEAEAYFQGLVDTIVALVGESLQRLEPATLRYSQARCGFAMNRRTPTGSGYRNHPNPFGVVDHTVPVLSMTDDEGELQAILFGYACHNTTMGFRRWLGDYAGYAQEYLEADHPGVTAMFLMGCGGDQNPYPRSELLYAQKHGRALASAVEAALEVNQTTPLHQRAVRGPIRSQLQTVDLDFTTPDREPFSYPVQVITFGPDLTLVALGTEVVVDYALRIKQELHEEDGPVVWVAGYSNVYSGYIPSRRVLLEGGYEASRPYELDVEERIVGKVLELNRRSRGTPPVSGGD